MPTFTYTARTPQGDLKTATIEAATRDEVVQTLRRQRLNVVKVDEQKAKKARAGGSIKMRDIVIFTRQFSTMINAGLPLVQALDILANQSENPALKEVTRQVMFDVESGKLTTWVGVGGSPESVVRAARYRLPLMLAIIGGDPRRFKPYVELYHRALQQFGVPTLPIGVHSPGHIAETDAEAREQLWPHYREMRDRIGAERGWPPSSRAEFEQEAERGSLYVGSPETVARKIAATVKLLGVGRFDLKYTSGALPHALAMRSIELYGREVIPRVRELVQTAGD